MKTITRFIASLCLLAAAMTAHSQIQQWPLPFGISSSPFTQNGDLVASRFNYQISNFGAPTFGAWTNFPSGCYMNLSGGLTVTPFSKGPSAAFNTTVTVTDMSTSANTETVAVTAFTSAAPNCTLTATVLNAHTGQYIVSSGTCGLREALNYLGTSAGRVVLTAEWFAQGCTAATVTGMTGVLMANQAIYDSVNNLWYTLQPSTLSALATPATRSAAAGATQVIDGTAVGTWANAAGFFCVSYMDALGGLSPCSASFTYTPAGSLATNWTSPAASTGAVGWIQCGGITSTSVQYCITPAASICTLSVLTPLPSCAMGANAVVLGPVTTTFLAPGQVTAVYRVNTQSHTTFAYAPQTQPPFTSGFQNHFGPFLATVGGTTGQVQVLATIPMASAVLNTIGKSITVRGHITMTAGTSETPVLKVQLGPTWTTGTPTNICQFAETSVALSAAVYSLDFTCRITTNATGASGTVMPGGTANVALGAGTTAGAGMPELGTAAITDNVSVVNWLYVTYVPTSGTDTAVQLLDLQIDPS